MDHAIAIIAGAAVGFILGRASAASGTAPRDAPAARNGHERARSGQARPPETEPRYAVRLHPSCYWQLATRATLLADGHLLATFVYVPGAWETTVTAGPGQWRIEKRD